MTYLVKAFCLLVLFVALEIGTEAQQTKPPLDISINKDCYGERCFKGQQCCGPKAKCQRCCRHQHCPMGQICRYFFSIHRSAISVTSEAAEVVEVDHLRIKIVTWNFTVTFLGISTVYPLMTMTMAGSGDEAFGINLKKNLKKIW